MSRRLTPPAEAEESEVRTRNQAMFTDYFTVVFSGPDFCIAARDADEMQYALESAIISLDQYVPRLMYVLAMIVANLAQENCSGPMLPEETAFVEAAVALREAEILHDEKMAKEHPELA